MQTFISFATAIKQGAAPRDVEQYAVLLAQACGDLAGTKFDGPRDSVVTGVNFYAGLVLASIVLLGEEVGIKLHDVAREGLPVSERYRELKLEFLYYQMQIAKAVPSPETFLRRALLLCGTAGEVAFRVHFFTKEGISEDTRNERRVELFHSLVRVLQALSLLCTAMDLDLSAIAQQAVDQFQVQKK